jgi:hypothetical protein
MRSRASLPGAPCVLNFIEERPKQGCERAMAEMVKATNHIDVTKQPELLQLAEDVRASGEACSLERDGEVLAVVKPVVAPRKQHSAREAADAGYEAFLAAAGGWRDLIDTDTFIQDNSESRRRSVRPPVEL